DAATLALLQGLRSTLSDQIKTLSDAMNGAKTLDRSGFAGTPVGGDATALVDGLAKQYDELVKVNEQNNLDNLTTEKKIALNGILGGQRQIIEAYYDAQIERLKALHDLSGPALTERLAQIAADEHAAVAIGAVNKAQDEQTQLTATGNELGKISLAQVAANIELTKKQTTETANQIKANQEFARTMTGDVLQAFDELARHGTLSFTNVAQAVEQLTIKLSKLPGMSADAAKAFQGINLGLAIAQTGYSLGAQSGNSTVGALGGAAEGAAAGSAFGPLGAAAGGLIGAASGLFGASNAHKEAAAALKQAADQLKTNVASYVAGASGSGVASALAQNKAQADALQKQLTDLLHKGGISGSDYTVESVQVQQSQQEIDDRTKQTFFRGITEQLNALQGPAGAYQNTLIDLSLAYDQNKKDAAAAGASTAQLTQIDTLYRESVEKATAAEQERITEQSTSIKIATDLANAHTLAQQQAADREQQQEEQRQRMFTLIQNGADAATIAAEQQRDAAEQAALATKQFADSINAVNSSVSQANDIMGTTGTVTGITNLATGYDATNGSGFQ